MQHNKKTYAIVKVDPAFCFISRIHTYNGTEFGSIFFLICCVRLLNKTKLNKAKMNLITRKTKIYMWTWISNVICEPHQSNSEWVNIWKCVCACVWALKLKRWFHFEMNFKCHECTRINKSHKNVQFEKMNNDKDKTN